MAARYAAVLFDLLTGLLDSWSLWDAVARDEGTGRRWRTAYLRRMYAVGRYR
ncbi:MAG TPA: haloacid dehalogenase, partial [Actinomycetes bacterium]|nr:haloacid dehalogenase [Actinomycetes bacterium]